MRLKRSFRKELKENEQNPDRDLMIPTPGPALGGHIIPVCRHTGVIPSAGEESRPLPRLDFSPRSK